jgi:hypothetical protein
MRKINLGDVKDYVNKNIINFHKSKLKALEEMSLKDLLKKKNPYLFKAKNIRTAQEFVTGLLDAFLSSSEEKLFGDFLEDLAIFISSKTCGGRKSSATGIDFEFKNKGTHYVVSVKSGPNWGNSGQTEKQQQDFQTAVRVLKQSRLTANVQAVLGICYGKTRTAYLRGYLKIVGQNFWYFISGDENLYIDIIEPLGNRARQHNARFEIQKAGMVNKFTAEFLNEFCTDGKINWKKLVEFNSGNLKKQIKGN